MIDSNNSPGKPKTRVRIGSVTVVSLICIGSVLGLERETRAADTPLDAPPVEKVIERGAHYNVVEISRAVLDQNGQLTIRKGQYTAIQNGMNRLVNGQWIESRAVVEGYPTGAIANQGPHQVIFSKNLLAEGGTIDLLTPDGKRLRAVPVGLGWKNAKTGQFAWIARAQDTVGVIQPPNVVVYENAFDSIQANLVVTYTTAGIEVWVVLKENPILPEGFEAESSLFQVITEFLEVPTAVSEKILTRHTPPTAIAENWVEPELTDVFTDWGAMQLWPGRAFPLVESGATTNLSEARVFKHWQNVDNRSLLFETLPYPVIRSELEKLPQQTAQAKPAVQERFKLAESPTSLGPKGVMKVAAAKSAISGFVVDYTVVYSQSTYTFSNGITYKIQSTVYISQWAQIQSGAILKYTTVDYGGADGYLSVVGNIITPYDQQPCAILTHVEDNSAGEPLGGDQLTQKVPYGLNLNSLTYYNPTVQRLEIRHANVGLRGYYTGNSLSVRDCVFKNCNTGIAAVYSTIYIYRTFMCDVVTPWVETGGSIPNPEFTQNCGPTSAPSITNSPANQTRDVGSSVGFSVTASGFALNYQWYFNNHSIAGATSWYYGIPNVQHSNAGEYYVEVENEAGLKRSSRATLTVSGKPVITVQPQTQSVPQGSDVTFSVEAFGGPFYNAGQNIPFYYYWYRSPSTLIQEGTSHEYVLDNVQPEEASGYFVIVTNGYAFGSATSVVATLTVQANQDRTYDSSADFDHGILINLNHNVAGQLQLNTDPTPLPYINVPCSGQPDTGRGTLARINVNSGESVGEYYTAPIRYWDFWEVRINPDPSRTAVDRFGNVWVANRGDDMDINGVYKGSITKIGIVIGGIRCDRSGAAPPYTFTARKDGEYLLPPFVYNTCLDRDGDGAIRTSRGLRHLLDWSDPDDPDDEAILKYVRVDCPGTRALAVDTTNNVWVGGIGQGLAGMHQCLNGETGEILWTSDPVLASGGYAAVINDIAGERWLWSTYPSSKGDAGHLTWVRLKLSDKTCLPNTSPG
ncbi:MAG: hypothetical protein M1608_06355, partial [Candidatus Omnitrophica bacterium]|nr:hypothetical protein [Candidatus Omnitrophota bacterium]